jgi:hypothetical protein
MDEGSAARVVGGNILAVGCHNEHRSENRQRLKTEPVRPGHEHGFLKTLFRFSARVINACNCFERLELIATAAKSIRHLAGLPGACRTAWDRLNGGRAASGQKRSDNDSGSEAGSNARKGTAPQRQGQILFSSRWTFSRMRLI